MTANNNTAVLDKSVLQRIAELSGSDHTKAWAELTSRFQIVVPFVLLEELLTNLGDPRETPEQVIQAMRADLWALREHWLADEIDQAFDELIRGSTSMFKCLGSEFHEKFRKIQPDRDDFKDFLKLKETEGKRMLDDRLEAQNDAAQWIDRSNNGNGTIKDELGRTMFVVKDGQDFFQKFVMPGFWVRDQMPLGWFQMLDQSLGQQMRKRYPAFDSEIVEALKGITSEHLVGFPSTMHCLMAKLFYVWAPLVRIGENASTAKRIVGRSERSQKNNIHDERYVGVALSCRKLLTCDNDMARMATCFKHAGLWRGEAYNLAAPNGKTILDTIGKLPR